jgi:hypothetical protein
MAKKILNEAYEWSTQRAINRNGEVYYKVFINRSLSEDTYEYKNEIKSFGALWDNTMKTWYFVVKGQNREEYENVIRTKVQPCVEFLREKEETHAVNAETGDERTVDEQVSTIIKDIDAIIENLKGVSLTTQVDTSMDPQDIKERLEKYKVELIQSFQDNTWREKLLPLTKFRNAMGSGFSLINSLLLRIQDPKAKMVKTRGVWAKLFNRTVIGNAPAIYLWYPNGKKKFKGEHQIWGAKLRWLEKNKNIMFGPDVEDKDVEAAIKSLTPGEQDSLRKYLESTGVVTSFSLKPYWFDVRYTEQIPGTEDKVGDISGIDDVAWFDDQTPETEETAKLFDAILDVYKDVGIKHTYSDDLDGARGVSRGGTIETLAKMPKDPGSVSTLIHELAHELLHQSYLKNNNPELSSFFVGKQTGTPIVEQQAEITAWFVMRYYGFEMQTARNYAAAWGLDDKGCVSVFHVIADVINFLINKINSHINPAETPTEEPATTLNESSISGEYISAEQVADAVGAGNKFRRGEQQLQQDQQMIRENFNRMLDRMKNLF